MRDMVSIQMETSQSTLVCHTNISLNKYIIFTCWQGNVCYENLHILLSTTTSDSVEVTDPAGVRSLRNSAELAARKSTSFSVNHESFAEMTSG